MVEEIRWPSLGSSLSYTQEQHEYSIATTRDYLMVLSPPF